MEEPDRDLFRKRLEGERARLLSELAQLKVNEPFATEGLTSERGAYGNHIADGASETFEKEKSITLERNLHALLGKVEHALAKFASGTYGRCDVCGAEIPLGRLEALPYANLCIVCKAREEKDGKNGRHRS